MIRCMTHRIEMPAGNGKRAFRSYLRHHVGRSRAVQHRCKKDAGGSGGFSRLEVQDHATRHHDIILAASLDWGAEARVGRCVVVTHFPAEADREPHSNGRADINAGAELRRPSTLIARGVTRAVAKKLTTLRDTVAKTTGDPRRDHCVGGELHAQRRYDKDRGQGYDGLAI